MTDAAREGTVETSSSAAGQEGWLQAVAYAGALRSGSRVPVVQDARLTLASGELVRLRGIVTHLRGYPVSGRGVQWGDRQSVAVLATTQRIVINHRLHGWTSFWLADLLDLTPQLQTSPWVLDLVWRDRIPALRLLGPAAPSLAVHVAACTDPAGWTANPLLQPILTAAASLHPTPPGPARRLRPGDAVVVRALPPSPGPPHPDQPHHDGPSTEVRASEVPAGNPGTLVGREYQFWRVRLATGREVLVAPALIQLQA